MDQQITLGKIVQTQSCFQHPKFFNCIALSDKHKMGGKIRESNFDQCLTFRLKVNLLSFKLFFFLTKFCYINSKYLKKLLIGGVGRK